MEEIKLIEIVNNEDSSSMAIVTNKNMAVLAEYINYILENSGGSSSGALNRNKLVLQTNATTIENDFYKVTKTISGTTALFTVTPIDDTVNMELSICEIRTFSNEKIICPTKYSTGSVIFEIDNLADVNITNPSNPINDTNNKIFIII